MMILDFQHYLDANLARKESPDMAEAGALVRKAEDRLKYSIKIRLIDNNTASYIFEDVYECIREAAQALMSAKGYKPYSHEALISFIKEFFKFKESDMTVFDRYRILRNKSVYRGEKVSAQTCKEAVDFVEKFLPQLKSEFSKLSK